MNYSNSMIPACVKDEDCPFNEICYRSTDCWVEERGANATCGCDYWHGITRDKNNECLAFGPGAYYFLFDCAFQIALGFVGFYLFFIVVRARHRLHGGKWLSRHGFCIIFAGLAMFALTANRITTVVKILTPQLYTRCCVVVIDDPRKYHAVRFIEIPFLYVGLWFSACSSVLMAAMWIQKYEAVAKGSSPGVVQKRKRSIAIFQFSLVMLIVFFLVLCIGFSFVNTGYTGLVAMIYPFIAIPVYVGGYRVVSSNFLRIQTDFKRISSSIEKDIQLKLQTRIEAGLELVGRMKWATIRIVSAMIVLFVAGCLYGFSNLCQFGDWKGASPPDEVSLNMIGNNWLGGAMKLNALAVLFFLRDNARIEQKAIKSAGLNQTGDQPEMRREIEFKSTKGQTERQEYLNNEGIEGKDETIYEERSAQVTIA